MPGRLCTLPWMGAEQSWESVQCPYLGGRKSKAARQSGAIGPADIEVLKRINCAKKNFGDSLGLCPMLNHSGAARISTNFQGVFLELSPQGI
jgi:hypothetical protein